MARKIAKLLENLEKLSSENEKVISINGKRIGPGKGASRNLDQGSKLSQNGEEAKANENLRNIRLGKSDASGMSDKEIQRVASEFLKEVIEKDVFEGM